MRLEPMDTDREDRHVADDDLPPLTNDRRLPYLGPEQAEKPDAGSEWLAGEDFDLGSTRGEWDDIRSSMRNR